MEYKAREKLFKGMKEEELKKLDTREFAKFLKARPRRAIIRNSDVIDNFVKMCIKKDSRKKTIKTHKRDLVIVPMLIGRVIGVYNGKEFINVRISQEMLGHRLGEFVLTRKVVKHGAAGVGATKSSAKLSVK
jgi:small subunit ribosomal protein S19